ncbi:MAG: tyrosine-type recombinase/integrase, partial [Candidatus Tectomicrobia bacterium]
MQWILQASAVSATFPLTTLCKIRNLTADERDAFLAAATQADRPIRTLCSVLYYTGCRISEALALTPRRVDIHDQVVIFETLKKRRRGVYRAVPVPQTLLETLDMVHGHASPILSHLGAFGIAIPHQNHQLPSRQGYPCVRCAWPPGEA